MGKLCVFAKRSGVANLGRLTRQATYQERIPQKLDCLVSNRFTQRHGLFQPTAWIPKYLTSFSA